MKNLIDKFVIMLCFFISYQANAVPLERTLHDMINRVDPSINISMSVIDLNTGKTLFQRNPNKPLIPASNMKLFSEAAVLMALGPDYRFKRQLSTDATSIEDGVLNGSVYIDLPGDPSFSTTDLNDLLSTLTKWNIKRISGNVVLVNANAKVDAYPPGRDPRDKSHGYGAPIAPLILNSNQLNFVVNPGKAINEPAMINVDAPAEVIALNNTTTTSSKPMVSAVGYTLDADNHLTTSGTIGKTAGAIEGQIAILNPLKFAQDDIKHQLVTLGITLDGTVIQGALPTNQMILASQTSSPLTQLMADTLKPSDNVFADSLFIHVASIIHGSPVNWTEANDVIKQFLQKQTGIDFNQAVLMDGSGLSKLDRISAQQTIELLRYIYTHFPITYEFIAALPISGQDGTLQKRFTSQKGLIRAKTGTMTGILSLSGYLSSANGHVLAFAIYINRNPKTPPNVAGRYRGLIDQMCELLLQQKPGGIKAFTLTAPRDHLAFQQNPSQAQKARSNQSQWRGLEMSLRKALQDKKVAVVYQPNELLIKDDNAEMASIGNILARINQKYPLSIVVESPQKPDLSNLRFLWVKNASSSNEVTRTWLVRPV